MKKLLVVASVAVSLVVASGSPAHTLQVMGSTGVGPGDCPVMAVGVAIAKPRLINEKPLNLAFAVEVGNHKNALQNCATAHTLRVNAYLYALPISGPGTLYAIANATALSHDSKGVLLAASALVPPGFYQLVGEAFIEDGGPPGARAALYGQEFIYDGINITPYTPLI